MPLKMRTLQAREFNRKLPGYLSDKEHAFMNFKIIPAGACNPPYMNALEQIALNTAIMSRDMRIIEDNEEYVSVNFKNTRKSVIDKFKALYDHCIEEWETDIVDADTGKVLLATRESFLELCEAPDFHVGQVIQDLEAFALSEGGKVLEADEEKLKN